MPPAAHVMMSAQCVVLAGTGVAERRDRRVNESRIFLRERVVAKPDRIEIAERMRLNEKVRLRREIRDQRASVGSVEIRSHGFFARVIRDRIQTVVGVGFVFEIRRDAPRRASAGRLDLDNFGAEIGKHLAAQRALLVSQIEQAQSFEQL